VLYLTGVVGETVGEILMFDGGIGASKVLGLNTTAGWVGVGLAIASLPVSWFNSAGGSVLSVAGFVCGAVQLGQSGEAGRDQGLIGLRVLPMRDGVRVVGAF
jgi:hypothetical protein